MATRSRSSTARRELVDAINARGLRIDRQGGTTDELRIPATTDPSQVGGPVDIVLVLVKGWATSEAADSVRPIVGPATALVTLQNGLGNEEVLRAAYPDHAVVIGVSVHTVVTVGTAHYAHTGVRDTQLGPSSDPSWTRGGQGRGGVRRPGLPRRGDARARGPHGAVGQVRPELRVPADGGPHPAAHRRAAGTRRCRSRRWTT